MSNAKNKAQIQAELDDALHDAWVSQTMLASVLATTGPVAVDKETAARDFDGLGIEIEEDNENGTLVLMLKEKE